MIETRLYLKALEIVNCYHEQVRKEALEVKVTQGFKVVRDYRDLRLVEPDDTVICVFKHLSSKFTITREYKVLRTDDYRFIIENDNGVKKWMHKTNGHFKLL